MQVASVFFAVSSVGLLSMVLAKLSSMKSGKPGMFSFLSRFDVPLASFVLRSTASLRLLSAHLWRSAVISLERSHHFIASLMHFFVQTIERRMRAWSEFARTRKVVRRDASEFIKDVAQYKKELKNGRDH